MVRDFGRKLELIARHEKVRRTYLTSKRYLTRKRMRHEPAMVRDFGCNIKIFYVRIVYYIVYWDSYIMYFAAYIMY
jgi:hypothetical protein